MTSNAARAAVVIDDIASVNPWHVRVEVRGRAEALEQPRPRIRIHPERIVSWGLDSNGVGKRRARTVAAATDESAARSPSH